METMTIDTTIKYAIFFTLAFLIAFFIGRKKNIGGGYSFFLSIFLSPIIGFIITVASSRYDAKKLVESKTRKIIGILLLIFGVFTFFLSFGNYHVMAQYLDKSTSEGLEMIMSLGCGLFTLGLYQYNRGLGKTFVENTYKETIHKETIHKETINPAINKPLNFMQPETFINAILDKHNQEHELTISQNPNPMITIKQFCISVILGLILSIFFNSGPYFGVEKYYIYRGTEKIELSVQDADNYSDSLLIEHKTNWGKVFYGLLTYVIIGSLIIGFIIYNRSNRKARSIN